MFVCFPSWFIFVVLLSDRLSFPSNCPVVTQLKTLFVLPKANFRRVGLKTKTTKHLTNNSQTELFKTEFKLGNNNTDTVNGHNILNLYSHQTKQSTFLLTAPSKAPLPTTILVWVINMTRDQSLAWTVMFMSEVRSSEERAQEGVWGWRRSDRRRSVRTLTIRSKI